MTTGWHGVFPAATTQFHEDLSVDLDKALVRLVLQQGDGIVHALAAGGHDQHGGRREGLVERS